MDLLCAYESLLKALLQGHIVSFKLTFWSPQHVTLLLVLTGLPPAHLERHLLVDVLHSQNCFRKRSSSPSRRGGCRGCRRGSWPPAPAPARRAQPIRSWAQLQRGGETSSGGEGHEGPQVHPTNTRTGPQREADQSKVHLHSECLSPAYKKCQTWTWVWTMIPLFLNIGTNKGCDVKK